MHHHPSRQPAAHDLLVEPPDPPPPDPAVIARWIGALRDGSGAPREIAEQAEQILAQHLFPTAEEDDLRARLGEAVMQLSMLDRVPLADHQLDALEAFLAGRRSWSAWLDALR